MATSDQDIAMASAASQGRKAMGKEGIKFTSPSAAPKAGTLIPRKNTAAGDPYAQGQGIRENVPADPDHKGASYKVTARVGRVTDPAAGATLANAKIIPATTKRNFGSGVDASY